MFGNKFAGDDIAREFLRLMGEEKFDSFQKEASKKPAKLKAEASVKPEDFLVAPEEDAAVSSAIDSKIEEMDSRAEDCEKCGKVMESCACDSSMADDVEEDESHAMDYMVDQASKEVFEGLGKIAASLRAKNENFAADVVAATALEIRNDLIKEAARKAFVIDSLTKMAHDLRSENDALAADMVEVTIKKIKDK